MKFKKTYRERIDNGDYAWRVVCYIPYGPGNSLVTHWRTHKYGTILSAIQAKHDILTHMQRLYPGVIALILHNYPEQVCQAQYESSVGTGYSNQQYIKVDGKQEYTWVQGKNPIWFRNNVYPFPVTRADRVDKILCNYSKNRTVFSNQS